MVAPAAAYAAALAALVVLDLIWIAAVMEPIFRSTLGEIALARPRIVAAVLFYLVYAGGLTYLAVLPASSLTQALVRGALLGLVAYATYDLTNLATLKAWTWSLTGIDVAWGAAVSALSAAAGFGLIKLVGQR